MPFQTLELSTGIRLSYLGPDLSEGPLPAVFYFALSAEDSLGLDPYNQPALYLSSLPMRVFSLTLPGHGQDLPPTQALFVWAEELSRGHNFVHTFIDTVQVAIDTLLDRKILIPDKIAAMGLSRGGFIAAHAAARIPQIQTIVGFAPLTKITHAKEFQSLSHNPLVQALDLEHLIDKLADRTIRCYIGNLDTRVGTRHCFHWIEELCHAALEKKIRSPKIELILTPSTGHQGHGTSKEVFHQGAHWIAHQLGAIHAM